MLITSVKQVIPTGPAGSPKAISKGLGTNPLLVTAKIDLAVALAFVNGGLAKPTHVSAGKNTGEPT